METFPQRRQARAPQAAILFDKFHIVKHLNEALDKVRKESTPGFRARTAVTSRASYVLLSRRENLTADGKQSLKVLLAANQRLNTAYLLEVLPANCGNTRAPPGRDVSSGGKPVSPGRS